MTRLPRIRLLALCFWLLYGCATLPEPPQPSLAEPYARLRFSQAMQLPALNDQTVETHSWVSALRVRPGRHTLRFVHINAGSEGSAEHAGQHAHPFTLEVHEGITYVFEAKT